MPFKILLRNPVFCVTWSTAAEVSCTWLVACVIPLVAGVATSAVGTALVPVDGTVILGIRTLLSSPSSRSALPISSSRSMSASVILSIASAMLLICFATLPEILTSPTLLIDSIALPKPSSLAMSSFFNTPSSFSSCLTEEPRPKPPFVRVLILPRVLASASTPFTALPVVVSI